MYQSHDRQNANRCKCKRECGCKNIEGVNMVITLAVRSIADASMPTTLAVKSIADASIITTAAVKNIENIMQ